MKNILLLILVTGSTQSAVATSPMNLTCSTVEASMTLDVTTSSPLKVYIAARKRINLGPYMDPMHYYGKLVGQYMILHNGVKLIKATGKLIGSESQRYDQQSEMTLFLDKFIVSEKVSTQYGAYQQQWKCQQK